MVDFKYIYYYIANPSVQSVIEKQSSGSTKQIELATNTVKNYICPLPSLEEQKRIIDARQKQIQQVVNGQQVFSQARLANAPTKEDFIENKMRYIPPAAPQNSTQQAAEQKTEQAEIKAPNTGFEESKFVVYIGVIASVLALVALGLNKQTKTSKVKF